MKPFKSFLEEETMSGNYVSIGLKTPANLPKMDIKTGKVLDSKDHHVTIMYSRDTDVPHEDVMSQVNKAIKGHVVAKASGFEAFDSPDGDGSALVLKLDSPELDTIHKNLKEMGLKHSYRAYKPHLSIAYGVDSQEAKKLVGSLNNGFKPFDVHLAGVEAEPIKQNWSDDK